MFGRKVNKTLLKYLAPMNLELHMKDWKYSPFSHKPFHLAGIPVAVIVNFEAFTLWPHASINETNDNVFSIS